ncbi:uncharacterized protein N7459_001108 [Penicillium hispanicum]|uniref:uncharacterized protein n=1 Tax=Penicillium hispanicum TaxID=1080232 RepID=UPI002541A2D1|nr:uncharacterized protein N7459_001108 [Penicillium hispanicum]KAJ5594900.1 hypothetical protein N7459_001108 [Penicillium hispanicum]
MTSNDRDSAIREAKLFVREVVRNDWEFNPSTDPETVRPTSSSSSVGILCQNREVSEWRCREFDSSGSELEPQSSDHELDLELPSALKASGDPGVELRRKRRRHMEEEMAWNEGLRMWMARRDAWSGARTRRQIRAKEKKQVIADSLRETTGHNHTDDGGSADNHGATSGASPHKDPQSRDEGADGAGLAAKTDTSLSIAGGEKSEELQRRQDQEEEQSTAPDPDEEAKPKGSIETSITEPDAQASGSESTDIKPFSAIEDSDDEQELDEPLVPVAPPFIDATNPVRATIVPSIYPSIYTKVVVQGMTPTIPVNLADLTKAMVQGWKADGQWPPKPAVSSIVLEDNATVPKKDTDRASGEAPRRKNSITSAMRKVFHNPFHRRGSSSHDAVPGSGATSGNTGSTM